ncbi:hypothetical protein MJO28_005047 [Puccinia striiformis f. sp. tritici]|uniref:Uncharacterized protein n=4 Tax=Puccinia striiformis TaxID=27350 RepID=A0A0L0VCG7_9BASI|nr:hypothetical protein Pst134EA_009204 [Puccinia striiformis f. sp. tritici]KAI9622535.1 hypothetical protein KEM48_007150 [Puccinia striiformis f. sp. tritici PST-130]KNE96963.1 hypothetical protein PSTG_09698 [Puccinia striiformis f. sp. tritici PST-78]POW00392.1 hypothetical protein PSHT_13053 [Puccinia striiformis]KAH9457977.1 hypothetical protein Pst134EB_010276 [Puccinia striiformis f. sp. tritici]KAH9468669.1 hypothetical protein Pst134EA_009204 [Puccinia striiformis f. sp. tritici]
MAINTLSSSSKANKTIKNRGDVQDTIGDVLPKLDQALLFKQLKPLTVPILGMLPIKNPTHSLQLLPIIASIKAIIPNHTRPGLMTPPMIHYIFFPFEQLYHQVNIEKLSESCLLQLLELSAILVRAAKLHEPNPLWTSKETLILNSILPLLIQKNPAAEEPNEESDQKKTSVWKPARSDESTTLALDLMIAILNPHSPTEPRLSLNLDNLYQNLPNLPTLSNYLLRLLFQHLVDILDTLHRVYANPKQTQPSSSRARKTLELVRLGLLRLSSSSISGGNGVDILSTFLPSITSKLTQLACLLAQRRHSSDLLSLILHTIEWLLVECLDDELPDIQQTSSDNPFQQADEEPLEPANPRSQSDIYGQVLEIAADWKRGQFHSTCTFTQAPTTSSSSPSCHAKDTHEILVKRNQSWLKMTSAKISIVLQRLSECLENHPSPIVQEAWIHASTRLIECTSISLRISPSSIKKDGDHPDAREKDGFTVLLEALISTRSNSNFGITHNTIGTSLANVTRSVPLASVRIIVDFIRANFRSLSNLLVKQVSGQDDQIIHLSSRIISALEIIIDLVAPQTRPILVYQSCFDLIDSNEFQELLTPILCRVNLVVPKVLDSQPDQAFSSGACYIPDYTRDSSKSNQADTLPNTFPNLSVRNIFDHKCIKALEQLVRTISRLVLNLSYLTSGSTINLSEIVYLDHLLQMTTTTNGAKPSDTQQMCLQLNALWTLGESIRALKCISSDDRYFTRFSKIEIFCLQGLKKLLDISESYRVEGGIRTQEGANKLVSSELMAINQDLEDLSVTRYSKGNDQLFELERLKPASISRQSDDLIEEHNFQALRTCLILRLIASLAHVFEGSFQANLSWVLYYVLAQLGSSSPYVNQHAMATVGELALYCGYASIANMLEDNSDYLTHVVSSQLLPHQYDMQAPFVLENLIRLVGLRAMLPLVEQILLRDLFELLDDYHGYDLVCEQVISVSRCVMSLMNKEIAFEKSQRQLEDASTAAHQKEADSRNEARSDQSSRIDHIFEIEQQLSSVRWALAGPPTDLSTDLERFKTLQDTRKKWRDFQRPPPTTNDPTDRNPQKPFGEIDTSEVESVANEENEKELPAPPLTGYQRIAAELMSKSANFLTHSSTTVRLGVSQIINDGIPILGSTSLNPHESSVLPIIQRFWTILLSRLDDKDDRATIETLNLFNNLCQHLGSFMSKKLVNEIWPRLRKLIESEQTPGRLRMASISSLAVIVSSAEHINWRENFVWEIVSCLLKVQAQSKSKSIDSVDRILDSLSAKGFCGSVLVGRHATLGLIVGMEFMTPISSN